MTIAVDLGRKATKQTNKMCEFFMFPDHEMGTGFQRNFMGAFNIKSSIADMLWLDDFSKSHLMKSFI